MKILLINLDRSPERLRRFQAIAGDAGLAFERVAAVDGARISARERAAMLADTHNFYPLGPGETGCFLSHRAAWARIAGGAGAYAAVLEDDIVLGKDVSLLEGSAWIPHDADLIKLETDFRAVARDRDGAGAPGNRRLHRLRSRHTGSAGYIMSRACAGRLLTLTERLADPVDQFLFNPVSPAFAGLVTYQLVPALCAQADKAARAQGTPMEMPQLESMLREERLGPRPRGLAKAWREVARPLAQAGRRLRHMPLPGGRGVTYRRVELA